MPYLTSLSIKTEKTHPFPYDVPAIKFGQDVQLDTAVTFLIGDNGTGKSTFLETIAYRLQLPHMDGSTYTKRGFAAAQKLVPYLELTYGIYRTSGFFFRAEDFGDYLNSIDRTDAQLDRQWQELYGNVPDSVILEMKENANHQVHHMRKNYGQELQYFSHGEAYLHIIEQKITTPGIYLLDEPEAALSPAKQLSLIYFILNHLKGNQSQFIIATHAPILMSLPGATIFEITQSSMTKTTLEETEHYSLTKSFLNNPEAFLRHLNAS